MKKVLLTLLLFPFLLTGNAHAQNADIQIIHNSSDPAAAMVDIYVNGTLTRNDLLFRTATPFLSVPSGVLLNIGIAPSTSTSVSDTLKNFEITLMPNGRYVAIANGVLNPVNFAANPDAVNTAFNLLVKDNLQATASNPSNVDFIVLHGATDAPTVDVLARNVVTLVDDAPFSAITSYISVPAANYILDVTPGNDNTTIVASYRADLTSLAGGTAVVVASGFLNPASNQNGPAFGLWAFLTNGTAIELPSVSLARLQVIHNAADTSASMVDVYLDTTLLLNDFMFRNASPFIDAPAGVQLTIGIAPPNSASVLDTLTSFNATLANGNSYVAVANGVLTPANFDVNPDAASTAFTLFIQDAMRESALNSGDVDLRVVHGATDAPTVDVLARTVGTLVDNASYGNITNYISVPPASFILDVTPGNNNSTIVASYSADLTSLAGGAAVVIASGFLNPATNQNGPAFGLWAFLPDGSAIELPAVSLARLQVIHNAADPSASMVDVYVDTTLLLNDFMFRAASPYIDVPAGTALTIGIAPPGSMSVADTLTSFQVTFDNGNSYIAVANGVLNPANFDANPDAVSTAFTLFLQDGMRETAVNPSEVDIRVVHGASDAPTVDVLAQGVGTLVDDATYGDITSYLNVPASNYILDITPGNNNSLVVASFAANITALAGQSAVILASGFLNPATNQNGPAFGLIAVLPDGQVILLNNVTGVEENLLSKYVIAYPNPANERLHIENTGTEKLSGVLSITDMTGRTVYREIVESGQQKITVNTSGFTGGNYILKIENKSNVLVKKLTIL